jgi:hypothetical protein
MDHILTKCTGAARQKEIWDLASEMWRKKTGKKIRPTIGQIMAGGVTKVGNMGENRLHIQNIDTILPPELGHLRKKSQYYLI